VSVVLWVTGCRPTSHRLGCVWLIGRFIDPIAEFAFVAGDVFDYASLHRGRSFDACPAWYRREVRGGVPLCTFEVLLAEFELDRDPVLRRLGRILYSVDIVKELAADPLAAGLLAVTDGALAATGDDQRLADHGRLVYDAVYAWCQQQQQPAPAGALR